MAKWQAVQRYAKHKNPQLFRDKQSNPREVSAALAEAERELNKMPKPEQDKWRKST